MPVYNAAPTPRESAGPALAQAYGNLDVITVDDGSTGASPDAIAEYVDRVLAV